MVLVWVEKVKGINLIELQKNFKVEDEKLRKVKHFPGA